MYPSTSTLLTSPTHDAAAETTALCAHSNPSALKRALLRARQHARALFSRLMDHLSEFTAHQRHHKALRRLQKLLAGPVAPGSLLARIHPTQLRVDVDRGALYLSLRLRNGVEVDASQLEAQVVATVLLQLGSTNITVGVPRRPL